MIFVTVGTHDQEFTRLIKRIDELALNIEEKIIVQRGYTNYTPKNCESFKFTPDLSPFLKKARLIISHAGMGTSIEVLREIKKPLILVPRQHKYNEHINDHQVGMAKHFEKKWGVKVVYSMKELTIELLNDYKNVVQMDDNDLKRIRKFLKEVIVKIQLEKNE